jgi:hypothetical protein
LGVCFTNKGHHLPLCVFVLLRLHNLSSGGSPARFQGSMRNTPIHLNTLFDHSRVALGSWESHSSRCIVVCVYVCTKVQRTHQSTSGHMSMCRCTCCWLQIRRYMYACIFTCTVTCLMSVNTCAGPLYRIGMQLECVQFFTQGRITDTYVQMCIYAHPDSAVEVYVYVDPRSHLQLCMHACGKCCEFQSKASKGERL